MVALVVAAVADAWMAYLVVGGGGAGPTGDSWRTGPWWWWRRWRKMASQKVLVVDLVIVILRYQQSKYLKKSIKWAHVLLIQHNHFFDDFFRSGTDASGPNVQLKQILVEQATGVGSRTISRLYICSYS